jgi:ribosome-associated translation inhibitor RaiA
MIDLLLQLLEKMWKKYKKTRQRKRRYNPPMEEALFK